VGFHSSLCGEMDLSRIQGFWLTSGLWVGRVALDGEGLEAQQTFSDWLVVRPRRVLGARIVGYNNLDNIFEKRSRQI
jgi:hypothetical protein